MIKLEEICGYIPHNLNIIVETDFANRVVNKKARLDGIHCKCVGYSTLNEGIKVGGLTEIDNIKLILRPLSDLTREIEHNWEKFVPIVKLYGLAVEESELMMFQPNMRYISEIDRTSLAYAITKDMSEGYQFNYLHNYQYFSLVHSLTGTCEVINQLQLFQKLFEWHFDVFGLIERGDAIDINTLKE